MISALRLLMALARLSATQTAHRVAVTSGLLAVAMVFALIGCAGFGAAFWIWLARVLDPISAALVIGGVGFVIAAILILVARYRRPAPSPFASPEAMELLAGFRTGQKTLDTWAPLIGLALLGFLMGGKSKD